MFAWHEKDKCLLKGVMDLLSRVKNLGVVALLWLGDAGALAAPKPNGWIMKQTSDEQGMVETRVTATALRLDTEDVTLLLLPPKYGLYMYNKKNKRYVEEPAESFITHTSQEKRTDFEVKNMGNTEMCGIKATKYVAFDKGTGLPCFEFWATRALNIPEKLADACMIFMSVTEMAPGHGLPLRATRLSRTGGQFTHIRTRAIERAYIGPEMFAKPQNYKKVKNFVALRGGADLSPQPDDLNYMMNDEKNRK